ncbi:MAG: AI-2E family transporter [Bacteroidia bacterium]|nr:AI-2E family transporter [Bacteroidia bacterium]
MNNKIIGSMEGSPVVNIAALIIIFAGMIYAKSIITPFLLALFISIICAQPITWLEKKRIPRWLALIIVILGMIILFSGFSFLIGGTLSSFSSNLSEYESTLTTISNSFIQFLNEKGLKIPKNQISNLVQPAKILEFTASALNTLFNMVGTTFLIFLIILFILMEFGSFSVKAKAIRSESDKSISYFSTILQNIRHYLGIKTLLCLSVGILIYLALLIIGVDYPLLWALIAGLMNYIPNIGSFIASIPTVLFALVQLGLGGALWTLGTCMLIHNVLGNFIEPKIMGKGLGLSTLVVFLSLLFWGFTLGMVGMFLSAPFTMTIKIILEQNEKTRWLAILLGTPADAKIYLQQKELIEKQQHKKSHLKEN